MGYYTSYSLEIIGDEVLAKKFEKDLLKESDDDFEVRELITTGGAWAKLYDLSDWIKHIAPKYPELLIVLSGDGEDSDDKWEERFRGSDFEHQDAEIPPFENPSLLTDYEKKKLNSNTV